VATRAAPRPASPMARPAPRTWQAEDWAAFLAADLVGKARAAWPGAPDEARQAALAAGIQARARGENEQPFGDIPDLAARFCAGWEYQDRVERDGRRDSQATFEF